MKKVWKIFKAFVCLLMVSYAIPAFSQEAYKFELMWGFLGTGDGQFNVPVGVVVDSSGNVYVADSHNNRIQKFDSNGNFLTQWGSPSFSPQSVAVDSSGNVYVVADETSIRKFDSGGNLITSWSILGIPLNLLCLGQITTDSLRNLYATTHYCCNLPCCFLSACPEPLPEPDKFGILKFDLNGNLIAKWGDWGTGDGQFNGPEGVAVDSSGHIYVADRGNHRIQKFDLNGNSIFRWGIEGTEDGQFFAPYGVAVDSPGNVYVSDSGNDQIQKFDSTGNFITKWGYWGQAEGQFDGLGGIAVDSSGNVYVADTGNHRIQRFSPSGQEPIPLPDLTGQWTSLIQRCRNTRIGPKCAISGKLDIRNIGNQNARFSFVRFYLSNDAYIDGADIFLKQVATGSVRMGTSKAKMLSYSFPFGETASGKYIIAVIDVDNAVTESNKSNNYAVFGPIQ